MSRPQIEHPGAIGKGNSHILDTLTVAYRAALKLAEDGYTVQSVEVSGRNPIIWVLSSRRCDKLGGVATVIRGRANGREIVMAAKVHGAQVQWLEWRH